MSGQLITHWLVKTDEDRKDTSITRVRCPAVVDADKHGRQDSP